MTTRNSGKPTGDTLAAYEARILAQIKETDARLSEFETRAREKRRQAAAAIIAAVKAARRNLEEQLRVLATTTEAQFAHVRTDVDSAFAAVKAALDELDRELAAIARGK